MIPDPRYNTFQTWVDSFVLQYPEVKRLDAVNEQDWQNWFDYLRSQNDEFSISSDPRFFTTWQEYVYDLMFNV